MFDQRSPVNAKEKRQNAMAAEGDRHNIIQFEGLDLRYSNGGKILSDMTFVLNHSSFHFLSGPGETGKTSLLRLMYLALRLARRLVMPFGHDISSLRQ